MMKWRNGDGIWGNGRTPTTTLSATSVTMKNPRPELTLAACVTGRNSDHSAIAGVITLELRKILVKCFVWTVALYGTGTWTLRRSEEIRLEEFEMWIWIRMERVKWKDGGLGEDDDKGEEETRGNPVPARSLLLSNSTKEAARLNVPIRRAHHYQQRHYDPKTDLSLLHSICRAWLPKQRGKLESIGQSGMLDTLYFNVLPRHLWAPHSARSQFPSLTSSRMWCPQVARGAHWVELRASLRTSHQIAFLCTRDEMSYVTIALDSTTIHHIKIVTALPVGGTGPVPLQPRPETQCRRRKQGRLRITWKEEITKAMEIRNRDDNQ
ncbi:hypothetical protein ANN_12966 [Periplaneta americana]|uniref:Uncharacterized protein n=1 Tax=Periplaneta americana TaxID=6978 RepID=A0ABQ8TJX9_PERAM|nr:hypothetical protein ANN_12966 [Periplaneta americana]